MGEGHERRPERADDLISSRAASNSPALHAVAQDVAGDVADRLLVPPHRAPVALDRLDDHVV
jgi:hypothetical protein